MTRVDLKKLNRSQLFELLLDQMKENRRMEEDLRALKQQIAAAESRSSLSGDPDGSSEGSDSFLRRAEESLHVDGFEAEGRTSSPREGVGSIPDPSKLKPVTASDLQGVYPRASAAAQRPSGSAALSDSQDALLRSGATRFAVSTNRVDAL